MVEVESLRHSYGKRAALSNLNLQVPEGEMFGVLGPNGCGKSTLFKILATILPIQGGRVTVAGLDLQLRSRAVRNATGVVFQSSSLDRRLSVEENLTAQGHLYGLSGTALRGRIKEVLGALRLEDRRNDLASTLSGGLRRKVEIAKALLHRPRLLLLDEASAGLDPSARRELLALLAHLRNEEGVTVIFTTHQMEEAETASRLVLMNHGAAVSEGTPAELKAEVRGDVVVFRDSVEGLAPRIRDLFQAEVHQEGRTVRVEINDGHRFIAAALEAFPGAAAAVEVHKPTLEDVFLHLTGERFRAERPNV